MTNITDLTFFTNQHETNLLERFKQTLKDVQFFDVLVGYFRTSGFYELYQSFEDIEKIRILVGINTDLQTVKILDSAKQIEIDFESHSKTKENFSNKLLDELYKSEDKYEVELGIRNFTEYLQSGKIEIRAHPSSRIHAKIYISRFHQDDRDYGRVITGSSNFTESGLKGNYEFNVELKNKLDVEYALERFEELWKESVELSEAYIETINNKTWLNDQITPYELYLKFLYEYLKEDINADDDLKTYLPDGFMELKYQKQAVVTTRKILDTYGGVFIADVVGLGKTYISALLAQNLPGKKLVICPPPIIDSWEDAFRDFGVRNFEVESLGKLINIIKKGSEKFDYIFVDEAHRFRNEMTTSYQLLHEICLNKKVILVSATPLNNSVYDFFALIKLFQKPRNSDLPGIPNFEQFFNNARFQLSQIEKSSPAYLEEVKKISKLTREKVLKYIMVRRTRTDVLKYFKTDIEQQKLFFPEVNQPKRIIYRFDEKTNIIFNKTIALIKSMTYARYMPILYLKNPQIEMFEKQQEINLVGFMKSRLVKRLESSQYAFEKTVERFSYSYERFIKMYEKGIIYISQAVDVYDYIENDNEDALEAFIGQEKSNKVRKYTTDEFNDKFLPDIKADLQMLKEIQRLWKTVPEDLKIKKFLEDLSTDEILKKSKLIIFTESKETGEFIYNELENKFPKQVMFFSSSSCLYANETRSHAIARDMIKENFDPRHRTQNNDIRILITTDVLAEGINLHRSNIVMNYDLPWNPTRVLQRVGRVNRIGTVHKNIYIYNFFPTAESDEHLGLEDNIKSKIQAFHETLGEDAKYLTEEEEISNHKLFGEELYTKLNSKNTYQEDDGEGNAELKYLEVIRNIRDHDKALFEKIKRIPKKARSARTLTNLDEDRLITFFRKGNLKKFYISDGTKADELTFDDAIRFFECLSNEPKEPIPKVYYDYLQLNKDRFVGQPVEDTLQEQKQRGGSSNEKYIMERIKIALKDSRLTDSEETFLNKVMQSVKQGSIPKKVNKKIKDNIEYEGNSINVYSVLKNTIPAEYLNEVDHKKPVHTDGKQEIILSEFLLSGDQ